jgi:hypothetical protein
MSTYPKITVLSTEIGRGSQDVYYTEVLRIESHTCQIRIRSDSYRFQCFATARVWSPAELRWNDASSIHYSQMSTEEGLAYGDPGRVNANSFSADRKILIDRLAALLAGGGKSTR